jgi:Na+/H+-dicarboxylate symporter
MCKTRCINPNVYFGLATGLGLLAGFYGTSVIFSSAEVVSEIFINLLKLVSLPIIFLSIVSTALGMENAKENKTIGFRVIKYTLLTTVLAAAIALLIYVFVQPVQSMALLDSAQNSESQTGYLTYLLHAIPSNVLQPFVENNVIGVLFLALMLSVASLTLPTENRVVLHQFFSSLFSAVMKMTQWIVKLMPLAIWAFITLFIKDLKGGLEFKSLALYLTCVLSANLIQAFIVLPLFLKWKGISPMGMARAMFPALSVAFFTKSSSAALPMAMKCAEENAKISRKVASFSLPLCTTINMNACAAFILTTVLFVSMSNGMVYSPLEMIAWIFIATIAAIGNAGVPMGCYFLASAFLAAMNVPLSIMGVILPFYAMIDMLESAINVWSDSCVAAVVNQETAEPEEINIPMEPLLPIKGV